MRVFPLAYPVVEAAEVMLCKGIRAMLIREECNSAITMEKVAEYLYYNLRTKDLKDVPDMEIPPELCLELLMAADFLQV